MSIKFNLILTYATKLYVAIISVLIIPLIINLVGKDAYGLIGFFSVLQSCLIILDAGIGGSLTRETAKTCQNEDSFKNFIILFKKIILVFLMISVASAFIGWFISPYFSTYWIESSLPYETVLISVSCMFIVFSIRYMQGPFRSFIVGLEHHKYLSLINIILATLSAPGSLILLHYTNGSVISYFIYQAIVSLFILVLFIVVFFKLKMKTLLTLSNERINKNETNSTEKVKGTTFKELIIFSMQLSALSTLWIIATQSDKLVLTRYMSMSEYSFYSIAVSVASMIAVLSGPISQILQPRLTILFEKQDTINYVRLFVKSFIGLSIIGASLAFFFIYYSSSLLYLWSESVELSRNTAKYVSWLVVGNVIAAMMNFVFILLYSYGQLRVHTIVYFVFCLFLVPSQIYVASNYLGEGSSIFYLIQTVIFFIIWGGYNFNRFLSYFITYFFFKFLIPSCLIIYVFYHLSSKLEALFVSSNLLHFSYLVTVGLLSVIIVTGYCYFAQLFKNESIDKIKLKV